MGRIGPLQPPWKWKWKALSHVRLFATPWTIESMEFSRPEFWSGWPFPPPGDIPNPGIEPRSPSLQADSLPAEPPGKPMLLLLLLSRFRCVWLCDPMDGSPPGSPVPGILQARSLEWVVISFSNAWKWKVKVKSLSRVRLYTTPWTAAYQAPPSMGFSRQEYWSGVPLPSPREAHTFSQSWYQQDCLTQMCFLDTAGTLITLGHYVL